MRGTIARAAHPTLPVGRGSGLPMCWPGVSPVRGTHRDDGVVAVKDGAVPEVEGVVAATEGLGPDLGEVP